MIEIGMTWILNATFNLTLLSLSYYYPKIHLFYKFLKHEFPTVHLYDLDENNHLVYYFNSAIR